MSISDSQNHTRQSPSISILSSLSSLTGVKPFEELCQYLDNIIQRAGANKSDIRGSLLSASLVNNAQCLNEIMLALNPHAPVLFKASGNFTNDKRYYEQIIYESKQVPTRPNWHDFFNGLIWAQFPRTKQFFNSSHIQQMALNDSAKKRTHLRDKLTHFDECGMVLFTSCTAVQKNLNGHAWQEIFVENASKWHKKIIPVIFGHAIWEMMQSPFIGLTAKATVIEVCEKTISDLLEAQGSANFYAICDQLLVEYLQHTDVLEIKKPWLPLPLLGIPGWSTFEQNNEFYANANYFMPKRQ